MTFQIERIGVDKHPHYANIPNWYWVESILRVEVLDGGLGGFRLVEERLAEPYLRDFSSLGPDCPAAWATEFDLSLWWIFLASDEDGNPAGGAAVAIGTPVLPMDVMQRRDLAVLWDIRVHPDCRGQGLGRQLFQHAIRWAGAHGYGQLGLETDNTNVPACRFYACMGCQLGAIHRFGYSGVPEVADKTMLLWYFDL